MNIKVFGQIVSVTVEEEASLIKVANSIDWESLEALVLPDLQKTKKGLWRRGRPLMLRIHLGIYLLQAMLNKTDRDMEQTIKYNAVTQLFCGRHIVDKWHVPDFTKIEEFRNRLSSSTQHAIQELIIKMALGKKFTNASWMDIDSTVQEANIAYPSEANLMVKLAGKALKLAEKFNGFGKDLTLNLKKIKGKLKEYVFLAKNTAIEKKRAVFAALHSLVTAELTPIIDAAKKTIPEQTSALSRKTQALYQQVCIKGPTLIKDIAHFIETHTMISTKILSLHAEQVACIIKGKLGKKMEFGRVFQLARIPGNFLLIGKARSLREEDTQALPQMIYAHRKIFGLTEIQSVAADKRYFSPTNINALKRAKVKDIGIQAPSSVKNLPFNIKEEHASSLRDRRAGIEPLIGHLKHGGFGKSRMKSDQTTETSAYRCAAGFNLRQFTRHIEGVYKKTQAEA